MITIKKQNELDYIYVSNQIAEAKIALQGAHIFHFQAEGKKSLLWLSETSYFEKGKAIRGGIPICWPWFGQHPNLSPNHGFARTALWEYIASEETSEQESIIWLSLKNSRKTFDVWPYQFELVLKIIVSDKLTVSLTTKNKGNKTFTISQALHSYFLVEDIKKISLEGLDQIDYYNKVDDSYDNQQLGEVCFSQETDRVYQGITSPVILNDKEHQTKIETEGSKTVVVWNPWEELSQKMTDLSDYQTMVCIETANAFDDQITIKSNGSHTLTAIINTL